MEDGGTDDVVSAPNGECLDNSKAKLLANTKRMDDVTQKLPMEILTMPWPLCFESVSRMQYAAE